MTEESAVSKETETTEGLAAIENTLEKFLDTAKVDAVYGKPVTQGDNVIIPSAEVLSAMAFGLGAGSGTNAEEGEQNKGEGVGGGGGGRVLSRPVAVVVASPEGVRVEPVLDVTKIALAAVTATGFMIGMLIRMAKGPKLRK